MRLSASYVPFERHRIPCCNAPFFARIRVRGTEKQRSKTYCAGADYETDQRLTKFALLPSPFLETCAQADRARGNESARSAQLIFLVAPFAAFFIAQDEYYGTRFPAL